ncbi:MAG: ABC transporter substrate-binding protein, partial [Oscillospiraceae bacterium]|nr:ABC transporter substrate-binding protein [Candidatus Equicaccousia limihippi]
IALLSQIFPDSAGERARKVARYSEDKAAFVKQRVQTADKKPSMMVLLQYSDKAIVTTGQNSFGQWWADAIGATNAANELTDKNSSKVTLEQVYKWNPDVVMITNFNKFLPKDIYQNTVGNYDWSGISAAKNQKVYKMPLGLYRSYTPGADTPVTLLWLAKTVYPDLFADVDITKETVDYYKTVFDIALTNEQAQSIFAPPTQAGGGDSQRAQ